MPLHRFSNWVPMSNTQGDLEEMALLAGQGVGLVHDVRPAGDIVRQMMADAAAVLERLSR
jgi:NAD(P)H-dependent flavin oxidoreductase YrpB (nitropropane dioxygenase family)